MQDLLELMYGRYNGGQVAPIGSYLNTRTLAIVQLTTDGTLPLDGTFVRVDSSATQTFDNIATNLNAIAGTNYTAASFHTATAGDNIGNPGQASDDA
ncbi:MAG TPA: hypothetical protein VHZ51_27470 [Ktedonobacteraceae bacterium]|jgi:ABC-type uncharacterized transport system permease subunit|nr:hypothetical protein [Ktedonobacteraceae bacterium]